jgi:hypothetical protein
VRSQKRVLHEIVERVVVFHGALVATP